MADTAGGTILVANLKGGCGKTVIATTLAAALAATGAKVALADADRQKSALRWTRRRPVEAPAVEALDWSKSKDVGERPKKLDWLVIDAPGALRGAKAEELIAQARLLIAPVSPSFYDLDATKRFLKEIEDLKRVRKGRVEVRLVGNRIRPRTKAAAGLDAEFEKLGHAPLARLSERAVYAELAEQGLSIFDRPAKALEPVRDQWAPILDALKD